ncbi:papain-like cysteine protease family protein [Caldanaerobius fijiensis]|uniref:papain-like cysteine protease family protein n=1 Tax=Caldanaerobius fijiensis TaxID=456330 RepID=UPI0013565313
MVRIQLTGIGLHAVVLCGYNGGTNQVTYNDPLYKDQQHLGYQEFSYNWQDCVVCFLL